MCDDFAPGTITKEIIFWIVCANCYIEHTDTGPSAKKALRAFREYGWRKRNGEWYCSDWCYEHRGEGGF